MGDGKPVFSVGEKLKIILEDDEIQTESMVIFLIRSTNCVCWSSGWSEQALKPSISPSFPGPSEPAQKERGSISSSFPGTSVSAELLSTAEQTWIRAWRSAPVLKQEHEGFHVCFQIHWYKSFLLSYSSIILSLTFSVFRILKREVFFFYGILRFGGFLWVNRVSVFDLKLYS